MSGWRAGFSTGRKDVNEGGVIGLRSRRGLPVQGESQRVAGARGSGSERIPHQVDRGPERARRGDGRINGLRFGGDDESFVERERLRLVQDRRGALAGRELFAESFDDRAVAYRVHNICDGAGGAVEVGQAGEGQRPHGAAAQQQVERRVVVSERREQRVEDGVGDPVERLHVVDHARLYATFPNFARLPPRCALASLACYEM